MPKTKTTKTLLSLDEPTVVIAAVPVTSASPDPEPDPDAAPAAPADTEPATTLTPVPDLTDHPEPGLGLPPEPYPDGGIYLVGVPGSSTPLIMWSWRAAVSVADFVEGGAVVTGAPILYDSRTNPPIAADSAAAVTARAALHLPLPDAA